MTALLVITWCHRFSASRGVAQISYTVQSIIKYMKSWIGINFKLPTCTWKHLCNYCQFLQIEEANDCRYDYVEIFSGTGSQAESLGRVCGNSLPSPVLSKAHKMMIKFHSDALIAKRGFKTRYNASKWPQSRNNGLLGRYWRRPLLAKQNKHCR